MGPNCGSSGRKLFGALTTVLALLIIYDLFRTWSWRRQQELLVRADGAQITAVMLSFAHLRRDNQLALIRHYGNHPLVNKFLWVWNSKVNESQLRSLLPRTRARVEVIQMERNSLNNRWLVSNFVETDAVLYLDDDDKVLHESCLHCLFRVWRNNSEPLQGIEGHYIKRNKKGTIEDYWNEVGTYNMVLPNHLIIHSKYLVGPPYSSGALLTNTAEYASDQHKSMREYIDAQAAHCDDFFINFMVGARTRVPHRMLAINYSGTIRSSGLKDQPKRKKLRVECLRYISESFSGFVPPQEGSDRFPQCVLCNPLF